MAVIAKYSGATTKSMKLTDICGCFVVARSIFGDTGNPSARSRSPCSDTMQRKPVAASGNQTLHYTDLLEKLLQNAVGPDLSHFPLLCRIGNVSSMQKVLQHH